VDIYVYAGDTPIMGEHTRPQILLPLEDGNFVFNGDEEIGIKVSDGKKRLNLYVYDGWNGEVFSQKVMDDIQLFYKICHDGEGEVYLICDGELSIITKCFEKLQ
jgi:hypothetical protein